MSRARRRVIIIFILSGFVFFPAGVYAEQKAPSLTQLKKLLKLRRKAPQKTQATTASSGFITKKTSNLPTTLPSGDKLIQFSFKDAPYPTIFDFIERITNLPIIGDRNVSGTVTYFSRKKMTVNEAMEELNLLLKEKGVVLIRTDGHLRVSKFPDALRGYTRDFIGAKVFLASDVPPNQVVRVFFRVVNLPAADLTNLLAEALPVDEVKLAAWKTTNRIQVVGLASRVRKIISLATRLDVGLKPVGVGLTVKIFHPQHMSPSALENILRTVVPAMGIVGPGGVTLGEPTLPAVKKRGMISRSISFETVSDDVSGILVVRAAAGIVDNITELVAKIDVPAERARFLARTIKIKYASPKIIASAIKESLKRQLEKPGKSKQYISVQADEANNSVIIVGPSSFVNQTEQLVKQLDVKTIKAKPVVIVLKNAPANDILKNVLIPYYKTTKRPLPAAADKHSNTIITWATGDELSELQSLIKELDESASEGRSIPSIRTYHLEGVDVKQLILSLTNVFGKDSSIRFGSDRNTGLLMVAAPEGSLSRIDKMINRLREELADEKITRTLELQYADAEKIATVLQKVYSSRKLPNNQSRIEIAANKESNTILLSGTKSAVEEAVNLIKDLDRKVAKTGMLKTYRLTYADAVDTAKMINDLYGGKDSLLKITAEPWSNTLFVYGSGVKVLAIEQLIKTADTPEPADMANNVAFISVEAASAQSIAEQIQTALGISEDKKSKDAPAIQAAEEGNYLIVTGKPAQIERVRRYVKQFDEMAKQVPEILAVRPIQKTSAVRIAQMLRAVVPQLTGMEVKLAAVDMTGDEIDLQKLLAPTTKPSKPVVKIGVDKDNNVLIVKGRPRDIEAIDKIIENLTANIEGDVQFRIYTLKHASPFDVAQSLEMVFNEIKYKSPSKQKLARKKKEFLAPRIQYRIRAIPAPNINSVIVRSDPRDERVVRELIAKLDMSQPGNVRIFRLKYARADAVTKNLREVFKPKRTSRSARGSTSLKMLLGSQNKTQVNVSYDLSTNSLIVSADKSQMQQVEQIIETIDTPEVSGLDVQVISLKSGKAETLAPMIQSLLQKAQAQHASQLGLKPEPLAITVDKRTNSLIVAGSARQFVRVEKLVSKLEKLQLSGPKRIFVVPLRNVDPNRAKQIIEQLIPGTQSMVVPNWQEQITSLIVNSSLAQTTTAPATTQQKVPDRLREQTAMQILKQLMEGTYKEQKKKKRKKPIVIKPKVLQPKTPDLSTKQIQSLAMQIKGDVDITAMPEQGALIISASQEDYQVIARILALLDMAAPQPVVKIYKLKNTQAVVLQNILKNLFARRKQPRGFPQISITSDPSTNSLIVSASTEMIDEIERVILELDSTGQVPDIEYRTFVLQNARATEVVPRIREMLKQILAGRGIDVEKLPFSINADDRTNTILVTAPKTYLDQFEKLIAVMDSIPSYATVRMEIVRLKRANADSIGALLNSLVAAQAPKKTSAPRRKRGWISMPLSEMPSSIGKRQAQLLKRLKFASEKEGKEFTLDMEKPILFLPDNSSQSIAILSTAENIEALKQIIDLFDRVPIAEDLRVRVFPLKHADAEELSKNLEGLFKQGRSLTEVPGTGRKEGVPANPSGEAIVYNIAFAADARTNTLIVSGHEASIALVDVLVTQLDSDKPTELYPIRIIALENSSANNMAKLLEDLMDKRLKHVKAMGIGKSAERMRVIISADVRSNSLLVSASPSDFEDIQKIINKLDLAPARGFAPVLVTLKNIDAEETAKVLRNFFKEQAQAKKQNSKGATDEPPPVIVPDLRSNSLLIAATAEGLKEAQKLLQKLDAMEITKTMRVAVIPLASADASELAKAMMSVLNPREGQKGIRQAVILEFIQKTEQGRELSKRAVKDMVYIYGEKASNLLIALAPEDTIELITALAKQIDAVAPSVNIRIFALENADADRMKKTIEELFSIGKTKRGKAAPMIAAAEGVVGSRLEKELLSVTADTRTNSLIVTGTKAYLNLIADLVEKLDSKAIEEQKTEVIALKNAKPADVEKAISTLIDNRLKLWKEVYGKDIAPERMIEQQVNIVADEDSRKVILQASPRYFDKVRQIIAELDEPPAQVMIQAMIVEVTVDDRLEYGFETVGQDLSFTKASNAAGTPGIGPNLDVIVGTDIGAAGTGTLAGFTFALNGEDFNLLLRAIQSEGKLQVLSRPQIMARDNVEAQIQIGQRVPYPTGSTTSTDTGNITTQIQYEDIGIILKVVPHINPDGYVILEVEPEISSINDSTVQISEGLFATVFNKTKAVTTVSIKDGETIVIGGLFRTNTRQRETKVPFLGDIPILEYLFKSIVDVKEKTELLIVLTPRLVDTAQKARSLSETERDLLGLLPPEVRESALMGRLKVEPEEEPTTRPADKDSKGVEKTIKLFKSSK